MVLSVSQVSNLVSPDMKRIQRGKFKAMNRDNMYRYLLDHGSWYLVSKCNEVSFGYKQTLVTNYHEPPSIIN